MDLIEEKSMYENIQKAYENFVNIDQIISSHKDLPFSFIPATTKYFNEQFYWDSFFIMQGLKLMPERKNLIFGMIENFFVMIDKYGYIPNSYNSYDSRTQPPFLSSMILIGFELNSDLSWLKKAYNYLKFEYEHIWMSKPRLTSIGLSRYADNLDIHNKSDASYGAMQECGWDNTLRFGGYIDRENKTYVNESKTHIVCPVDLNCLLYKYEIDLEYIAKLLNLEDEEYNWKNLSEKRKELINKYMWSEEEGFYFDYDLEKEEKIIFKSLASYFTLWSNIADTNQANKMISKLDIFERDLGLACTEPKGMSDGIQWGYPNGWAPLHFISIEGFKNYGFLEDSNRITKKWLANCALNFIETNRWDEKLSVDPTYKRVDDARYVHQSYTSWTAFLFKYFYETSFENQINISPKICNINFKKLEK